MPLITGGALTGLLARFGIRLPGGLERMFGGERRGGGLGGFGGTSIGRDRYGDLRFERRKDEGLMGGLGGLSGGLGGAIGLAKMFM